LNLNGLPELNFLKGPKGDKGYTGATGEGIKFGHLIVIKHVINLNGAIAKASDYTIRVDGNNQSPDTFPGSEDGTDVTLGFGSYSVSEKPGPEITHQNAGAQFSKDCSGVIHEGETKTCEITNTVNKLL